MLIERAEQVLNSTDLSRKTKEVLDAFARGSKRKLVVMRDNKPMAVMLSIKEYESQMDELADLRIDAIAADRLARLNRYELLSHAAILEKYAAD